MRKVSRKRKKWAVATSPGPHSSEESLPLSVSLRENLKFARSRGEAEKILGQGQVQVDGKVRKDPKYPIGFMDVVKIPKAGESWRVFFNRRGHLRFHEIGGEESEFKLVKVVGKVPFKGEKLQLSLNDGKTVVGEFESVEVGDTMKVNLPKLEVQDHIPREEGSLVLVTGGSNVGGKGKIKEVSRVKGPSSDQFVIEGDGEEFQSPEEYVFVIGKETPEISLPEGG